MLIDIHTHTYYKNPDTVILLNVFPHALENLQHPCSKSVGLHPWHIDVEKCDDHLKKVAASAGIKDVIALGETGLDKTIAVDYTIQNKVFSNHIDISESTGKPVILHCVRSYSEILGLRKKTGYKIPWIFHWFNADMTIAAELLKKNCYLSFGHMLYNDRSKAYSVFPNIPRDKIFFETDDAGYTIHEIYSKAAMLLNMDLPSLQKQIMDNFACCFHN